MADKLAQDSGTEKEDDDPWLCSAGFVSNMLAKAAPDLVARQYHYFSLRAHSCIHKIKWEQDEALNQVG